MVNGDFVAQIKVTGDFKPGEKAANDQRSSFNGAGLLVWQDEKNYIRLERNRWYVTAEQKYACFPPLLEYYKNGECQDTDPDSTLDEFFKGRSTWLRLERKGDKVIASYSHDNKEWTEAKEITVDLPAELSVGVAAINTSAEALTVEFDEYRVEGNAGPSKDGAIRSGPASILPNGRLAKPLVVVGFISLGLLSVLGVLLHLRRRAWILASPGVPGTGEGSEEKPGPAAPEAAAPFLVFACPGCGKNLRARAALVRKSLKCPGCGQGVLIPEANPGSFAPRASTGKFSILKDRRALASVLVLAVVAGVCSWLFWPWRDRDSFPIATLGNQSVPGVQESGFYRQEYNKAGEPFRWTNGKARLTIPIDRRKPPKGLVLKLEIYRPAQVKTVRVQIVANNRELTEQQIPLEEWDGASAGKFPDRVLDLTRIDLGDGLVLDIISDTFIPGTDRRTLGVVVSGVELRYEAAAPQ
jgi:regulation of enolase protein 1 (concanavalin A-like superfamily)